jgi:hypothetical protein
VVGAILDLLTAAEGGKKDDSVWFVCDQRSRVPKCVESMVDDMGDIRPQLKWCLWTKKAGAY